MDTDSKKKNLLKKDMNKQIEDMEKQMKIIVSMLNKSGSKKKKKKNEIEIKRNKVISEKECEQLLELCRQSKNPLQDCFLIYSLRFGMRIGTIIHMRETWIDYDQEFIRIPPYDPCHCSYCKGRMKKRWATLGKSKKGQENITDEEVKKYYWRPKTDSGARTVWFGFDSEYKQILKKYFAKYEKWPLTYNSAWRIVMNLFDLAGIKNHKLHDFRGTRATCLADKGLSENQLMSVFGWKNPSVAREYVQLSSIDGVEAVKKAEGYGKTKSIISDSRIEFYITDFGRKAVTRKKRSDEIEWLRDVLFSKDNGENRVLPGIF